MNNCLVSLQLTTSQREICMDISPAELGLEGNDFIQSSDHYINSLLALTIENVPYFFWMVKGLFCTSRE